MKNNRKPASVKTIICVRCGKPTSHTLYNSETKTYKCNICGTETKIKK